MSDLPDDLVAWIERHVPAGDRTDARDVLAAARIEDGSPPGAWRLRCALVASGGCLDALRHWVALLAVDWRDVVVAGEYIGHGRGRERTLLKVRDLRDGFPADAGIAGGRA